MDNNLDMSRGAWHGPGRNKLYSYMAAALVALAMLLVSASALAAGNPSSTGQPNSSCEESTTAPRGFSSGGFAKAELDYAGSENSHSADNSHAVSQYDVACYQLTSH